VFAAAGAVIAGGIACAISATSRAAVYKAAEVSRRFVFDPNYRPRLTSVEDATAAVLALAPKAFLVTPSFPGETSALLGTSTPEEAATKLRSLGTANVAVTCGATGIQLESAADSAWIDAIPAPAVVDQTGAGDAFVGTLTARLVLGDTLPDAVRYGAAAASLVVGGKGGTGLIPSFEQTRAHAAFGAETLQAQVPGTVEGELSSHA
jgi:2-dehydro-3-deoxygluconokinase